MPQVNNESIYYYGTKNIYFLIRYFYAFFERISLAQQISKNFEFN